MEQQSVKTSNCFSIVELRSLIRFDLDLCVLSVQSIVLKFGIQASTN